VNGHDSPLRDDLTSRAADVETVDLYERSLRRSRAIGRRRAATGAATALVILALAGGKLWQFLPPGPAPVPAASSSPATVITAVPGTLFYAQTDGTPRLMRLRPGTAPTEELAGHGTEVAVSPDGTRLAYVADGSLMVAETGGTPRQLLAGVTDDRPLAWAPRGDRILVGRPAGPGLADVATGVFTPLPGDLRKGIAFRFSGDGSRIVYGVDPCRLAVAPAAGTRGTTVPVLGDPASAVNPSGLAACVPAGVDAAGTRAAVPLQGVGGTGPEGGAATAVVDLTTGAVLPLAVPGTVESVQFHPDGLLLVRSGGDGTTVLTVSAPDGTVLVRTPEPASVRGLSLVAWTR
jgi:TolB protein